MKFIKQSSIDNLLDEARIYDVVAASEKLKKAGTHDVCLSPFTGEKSASFVVNSVKNIFYDNSAGFGGNTVSFVMKRHNLTYYPAIEKVAEICGIVLEYETQSEDQKKINDEFIEMKRLVEFASEQYQKEFKKQAITDWPMKTMITDRGFSEEVLQLFQVGYAPNVSSFISTPMINSGDYALSKDLGYTITKDSSSYDFFRNRIMFPIHNDKGDIVGFGGRRGNEESEAKYAKYLNSKESKIYHKERILYGFWQAKKHIAAAGKAILIEGYTDVIALHQHEAQNSVATCGTSLSEWHAKLLLRVCKHVILFRDGDKAGLRAIHRDIDILLKAGFKVEVVICPDNEDPDSLSKKCNINEFIEKNRQDAVLWKAKFLQLEMLNPERETFENKLKERLEKDKSSCSEQLISDEAMKGLDAIDKKRTKKENDEVFKTIRELEKEMRDQLADFPKYDASAVSHAAESMANTLHAIPNKVTQNTYVGQVAKILELKPIILTNIITTTEEAEAKAKKAKSQDVEEKEYEVLGLPKGADKDQFLEDRFCEIGNVYWFQREKSFMIGTNFRITPLFHIDGRRDNKRLCEVINIKGHKRLIDFDSKDLINFTRIKERLIDEGEFFFEPGTTPADFQLIAKKILGGFISAKELKILGFQKQGFFAFADGIYHNNDFCKVNKYGVVNVEGLENVASEYKNEIKHYYSPAFSEIYMHDTEGDDEFENERHFIYRESPVLLSQWMDQMVKVFGDKGKLGVAFCIATNFRDLFLKHWNFFPLMGGFGQKDSGKSGFGSCLQAFFYYNFNPFELNTSTLPGLSRRLTRCVNTVVFCDEMRDDINEDMHQTLKAGWNGVGREKGKGFDSNKTTVDKINSTVYYAGQYLPTRDDGALPSRSILLNFENKHEGFTAEEKQDYNNLISWNKTGISSFILDVIRHRDYISQNITRVYNEVQKELKASLINQDYQNRVFENYGVLLVIVKMLEDKIKFPFKYAEFLKLTTEAVVENSDTIADGDGLAAFWRIVEYLADPMQRAIRQGEDFVIERCASFEYIPKKGEKAIYTNSNKDKIIFIYFSKIHQDYHKEVSKRQGEEVIGQTTIRNYLKSKKYFIGLFASRRMGKICPSGYAFNYSMMQRAGILNLDDINDTQTELDTDISF